MDDPFAGMIIIDESVTIASKEDWAKLRRLLSAPGKRRLVIGGIATTVEEEKRVVDNAENEEKTSRDYDIRNR